VDAHDFADKELGKAVPYGVYDASDACLVAISKHRSVNAGFVSVGITSDTAEFAVEAIRKWLERMGRKCYPEAQELTIAADCGGSNGARVRLWKVELQKLADETGLTIHVHHYPPGTSEWNKIEHRMFCHITQNWRGRPLTDRLAVVELIGATTTKAGLKVECVLDERTYEKGIKVTDSEVDALDIAGDTFHPEWNYTIKPRHPAKP
jgi:Rhodopirellula transposase DDE domain